MRAAVALGALLTACGGTPPASPAPPATPAPPIEAATAEVTFAVFQAEAPRDVERATRQRLRTPPRRWRASWMAPGRRRPASP
ncbi:MAG: hypothetical protein R3F60_21745 [bacterium]